MTNPNEVTADEWAAPSAWSALRDAPPTERALTEPEQIAREIGA